MTEPDLKVQIEKLSPREGNLLLIRTGDLVQHEQAYIEKKLGRILAPLGCKAIVLTEGIDAKLLDGEAMLDAAGHLEAIAEFLAGGVPERKEEGCIRGPAMAKRYRQTAETIRAWLIPKDEEAHDGTTDRAAAGTTPTAAGE